MRLMWWKYTVTVDPKTESKEIFNIKNFETNQGKLNANFDI